MRFRLLIIALIIGCFCGKSFSQEDEKPTFVTVDQMPEYIGGMDAMFEYLSKNLRYPEDAINAGIQGIVYVSFVVTVTGKVTEAKILRGIHESCDAEALRVVQEMPYWIPGSQRGKKVNVQFNLPVRFILGNQKMKKSKKRKRSKK